MAATENNREALVNAVKRRFGAGVVLENFVVPTIGGSNETTLFDVVDGASRRRMAARRETYNSSDPLLPFLAPHDQFKLIRAAFAHGVPAPEPLFEFEESDALGRGYVTAFVAGESMPKRILSDAGFANARDALSAQSAEVLAKIHAIPYAEVAYLEDRADSKDPIAAQLARMDAYGEAHPAVELGVRWLQKNRPDTALERKCVHGDYRTGNLLVGEKGLTALLDWECAHIGDGHEDLGWLCLRSWRFGFSDKPVGGFGDREALYRRYEEVSGHKIDPDLVHWWEVFGFIRWIVLNMMQAYGHEALGRRSVAFAACGRNAGLIEYELLMTLAGHYR